jgi:CBS domain-containing protein
LGVVTKIDLIGAYYAGLPLKTSASAIMVGPPLFCHLEDSLDAALDAALDQMRAYKIHWLYVREQGHQAVGVLAYPDIVGLPYPYCHQCDCNVLRKTADKEIPLAERFRLRVVMTPGVYAHDQNDGLLKVMEGLVAHKFGALLITGRGGEPVGVISKTDLILAYKHRMPAEVRAATVMTREVQACDGDNLLVGALRRMIFADVSRLFVYQTTSRHIVGVFSLSDAARLRSGTCRACVSSRIHPH